MKKSPLLFFLFILLLQAEPAYQPHESILIADIHETAEEPYIIEGYEITNPSGSCIKIMNSQNVIIRDNYLHDCGVDEIYQQEMEHYSEGYAVLIGKSSDITFEDNHLEHNWCGSMAYASKHLRAVNNKITNTTQYSPL